MLNERDDEDVGIGCLFVVNSFVSLVEHGDDGIVGEDGSVDGVDVDVSDTR